MKLNAIIATAMVTAVLGLQIWTLTEVVNLKIAVAKIQVRLTLLDGKDIATNKSK